LLRARSPRGIKKEEGKSRNSGQEGDVEAVGVSGMRLKETSRKEAW